MNFEDRFLPSPPQGEGIILYGSNDPEELVRKCVENLTESLSDPFKPEEFLVQSLGMASWLQLELAARQSVCANVEFGFPGKIIWKLFRAFFGKGPEENPYTKPIMAWRIYNLFPRLIAEDPETFAGPARYIEKGKDGDRSLRLSWQLANLFDSYQTYRPEMILSWKQQKFPMDENRWQGLLWLKMRETFGKNMSLPELWQKLGSKEMVPAFPDQLPDRLSVFGISTLPPVFLDVLQAYGRWKNLNIYALQPAPVQWGEVESEKWQLRALVRAEKQAGRPVSGEALHVEKGNVLIGSQGRTGREFFNLLVDRNANDRPLVFRKPSGDGLLNRLQRSTFDVFDEVPEPTGSWDRTDETIMVNSCHGPMRETEVLRDYLLRRFAHDDDIQARDVVVMMPDPEGYASYIRATFGSSENGMPHFPFSIVDREPRKESHLVDTFFDLLEFVDGRATNRDVIDLMDSPAFRMKFELEDADLEVFRGWIQDCNAYWGFDKEHRSQLQSTSIEEHTWRRALDRMSLGFCMRGDGGRIWEDLLPYDEIEGGNAIGFAKFAKILRLLGKLEENSREDKTPTAWVDDLRGIIDDFLPKRNETLLDMERISKAVDGLGEDCGDHVTEKAPLRAIRYHFTNVLEGGFVRGQFLTRGVTFCGLRPMRSVPARVICLLGMNDGAFPRQSLSSALDLSGARKPGDRSSREDDRYLFLETLWCAKDYLYVSYVGQSIHRNQSMPPSVVVNEMLDALDSLVHFTDDQGNPLNASGALVRQQALHPFGHQNYDGKDLLRSYSVENLKASMALMSTDEDPPPFVTAPLATAPEELLDVSLDDLIRFFSNPCQYFLRERLCMSLWEEDPPPEESEPFEIGALAGYQLRESLFKLVLEDSTGIDMQAIFRAGGNLPPGSIGQTWCNEVCHKVKEFHHKWEDQLSGEKSAPVPFEGQLGGFTIHGETGPIIDGRQTFYRCSKLNEKDRLKVWIRHLCVSAFLPEKGIVTGHFATDKERTLPAMDEKVARQFLQSLLQVYVGGMSEALPFFPKSSLAYIEEMKTKSGDSSVALIEARKKWNGSQFSHPEKEDAAVRLCYRSEPFNDTDFAGIAGTVYSPMLEMEQEQ